MCGCVNDLYMRRVSVYACTGQEKGDFRDPLCMNAIQGCFGYDIIRQLRHRQYRPEMDPQSKSNAEEGGSCPKLQLETGSESDLNKTEEEHLKMVENMQLLLHNTHSSLKYWKYEL